jgi:hypothetical protein
MVPFTQEGGNVIVYRCDQTDPKKQHNMANRWIINYSDQLSWNGQIDPCLLGILLVSTSILYAF